MGRPFASSRWKTEEHRDHDGRFVATKEGPVIVQLNGTGKWDTHYIEK
jgi:hypothetical protein